ncbi:required for meiotic nuclear division protein 1 homolog [Stomoxys calcitrans]|uniref:required for meiotic nuclear division protein 1 homolog n=1 Tax=Stomoxys calcitrans TaxID=35570 RepID=UPI0027E3A199|nr:required for meiotic nuclear division protein 1 homolog [Stomoxys calcitrans]
MNFARILIRQRYTAITLVRATQQFSTKIPSSISDHVPFKSKVSLPNTTNFKIKMQNLEARTLTVPHNRGAHKSTATAPNTTSKSVPLSQVNNKRKKRAGRADLAALGFFNITAFSTAEEYDLENLLDALRQQELYDAKKFFSTDNLGLEQDVLYVTAKYQVGEEDRDIFFFREGSVVMWNFNDIEINNVLSFLRMFEKEPYLKPLVRSESEVMPYTYIPASAIDVEGDIVSSADVEPARAFFQSGKFFLTSGEDNFFSKYTFSNALSTSIKLGIWEATLDRYIDSMEFLTNDMKKGRRIRISRAEVLRKTGELLALRHVINLSSDLLDTPDFYWDREELEALYLQVCNYFSISRRTKVMNEKINHCVELAELISHNLNEAHNTRLEWMIIILIMIEVGFEIIHYLDRYYVKEDDSGDNHVVSAAH